jgi:hypothetical protein
MQKELDRGAESHSQLQILPFLCTTLYNTRQSVENLLTFLEELFTSIIRLKCKKPAISRQQLLSLKMKVKYSSVMPVDFQQTNGSIFQKTEFFIVTAVVSQILSS